MRKICIENTTKLKRLKNNYRFLRVSILKQNKKRKNTPSFYSLKKNLFLTENKDLQNQYKTIFTKHIKM